MMHELGWTLILVGGPMALAGLWVLWDESAWRVRWHRNRAARRARSAAAESFRAGRWL